MQDLYIPVICLAADGKHVRRMCEVFRTYISSNSDTVDLRHCCLPRPFSSLSLVGEVETWGRYLDL